MKLTAQNTKTISISIIIVCLLITLLGGRLLQNNNAKNIGDYSSVDPQEAIAEYEAAPGGEALARLCHVLCYHWQKNPSEELHASFVKYGQLLLDGAKEGSWDLEKLDNEKETLANVIAVLRQEGVR